MLNTKKKCCVFTIVKNESVYLSIWLRYYSRFFDGADIYVLDHDSNDGSIDDCLRTYAFNHELLHHDCYDERWKVDQAQRKQIALLESYDYVLYADADEILIPDLEIYADLRDYIDRIGRDTFFVKSTAYCVIHMREDEPAIDIRRSVLEQRLYWYRDALYDKVLLAARPLRWTPGFHYCSGLEIAHSSDLVLLHLQKFDYLIRKDKVKALSLLAWDDDNLKHGLGSQCRISHPAEFDNWFYYQKKPTWHHVMGWLKATVRRPGSALRWKEWKNRHGLVLERIPRKLRNSRAV